MGLFEVHGSQLFQECRKTWRQANRRQGCVIHPHASTKMQHREAESYGRSVPLLPCAGMFAKPSSCALEQNAGMARNGYNILLEC